MPTNAPSMRNGQPARLVEYALLLLLATLWASTYVFAKIGIETIAPATFICGRSLLAAVLLLVILRAFGRSLPVDAGTWRLFATQALVNSVAPFLMITWAQQFVDAGTTVVLSATTPIFTFLITWGITRHESATAAKLFGVLAGLAGVAVVIGAEAVGGFGRQVTAQVVTTLASILFAIGTIRGRHLAHIDPMVAAAGSLLIGGLVLLPVCLAIEQPWSMAPSSRSLSAMVLAAVFSSAFGLMLFYRLVGTLGPVTTSSQSYLRVPIGVGLGAWLLDEKLPSSMIGGIVLVMFGVWLMTRPPRSG